MRHPSRTAVAAVAVWGALLAGAWLVFAASGAPNDERVGWSRIAVSAFLFAGAGLIAALSVREDGHPVRWPVPGLMVLALVFLVVGLDLLDAARIRLGAVWLWGLVAWDRDDDGSVYARFSPVAPLTWLVFVMLTRGIRRRREDGPDA